MLSMLVSYRYRDARIRSSGRYDATPTRVRERRPSDASVAIRPAPPPIVPTGPLRIKKNAAVFGGRPNDAKTMSPEHNIDLPKRKNWKNNENEFWPRVQDPTWLSS